MSGVPSRFCRIWAISFDDMFGASPFIVLPPCFIQSYTTLHPPAVHPPDGLQALKTYLRTPRIAPLNSHSDVERSRLYSGLIPKSSGRWQLLGGSCPALPPSHTLKAQNKGLPSFIPLSSEILEAAQTRISRPFQLTMRPRRRSTEARATVPASARASRG